MWIQSSVQDLLAKNGVHEVGVCERHCVDVDKVEAFKFVLTLVLLLALVLFVHHKLSDLFKDCRRFSSSWHSRDVET